MKQNRSLQHWLSSAAVGLALTAAPSLGLAADIVYSFDSDTQGWGANNAATTLAWDGTKNRGTNGGCLKCTLAVATDSTLNPAISVNFDTSKYFDVEFDIMIDPASGTDGAGTYGNLQIADFDSTWSWHSAYFGNIGTNTGVWKHVKMAFQTPYQPRINLQILLQPSSGAWSGDVIAYIDNVVIQDGSPGSMVALEPFRYPEECVPQSAWGPSATWGYDNTLYAGGALKAVFDYGTTNTGWQDGAAQIEGYASTWDPAKFTYIAYDVYLDAPTGLPSYGQLQLHYLFSWASIATTSLSEANVGKWVRYTNALTSAAAGQQGLVIHPGGNNMSGIFSYYFKNITVWVPPGAPRLTAMRFEPAPTGAGAEILMNAKNNQWQRDAICVPSGTPDYSWVTRTPLTYSFTITNFPDAKTHSGYEAHLFIVNESTIPAAAQWNETYGGCDWNAADLVKLTVENNAAGGAIVRLSWKTGMPGANPPAANTIVDGTASTALGTWSLNFDTDTTGTITGPGGYTTNFTLPDVVATQFNPNAAALVSFFQLGMGQNDGTGMNKNYNVSGVFSAFSMSGGLFPFFETFPGPTLTSSGYSWRTTGNAVQYVPANTGAWVTWTTPDDGYSLQYSPELKSWSDAGVVSTYSVGATKLGAVPSTSVPAGKGYFRMLKP